MNTRLSFNDARDYLQGLTDFAGVHIGTSYDADYITRFPEAAPAVWLVGQQATKQDSGRGYSGYQRQHMNVELAVRVCVARFVEGEYNAESALQELANKVTTAIFGWKVTGAANPFTLDRTKDGAPFNSVVVADFVFSATFTFTHQ